MTSSFEPFSILYDDRAPSLHSPELCTRASHLLLALTTITVVFAFVLRLRGCVVAECKFEELNRIPCSRVFECIGSYELMRYHLKCPQASAV